MTSEPDQWQAVRALVHLLRTDPAAPGGVDRLRVIERTVASVGAHVRTGGSPDPTELRRLAALALAWLLDKEAARARADAAPN